jgi:hypothetical protein
MGRGHHGAPNLSATSTCMLLRSKTEVRHFFGHPPCSESANLVHQLWSDRMDGEKEVPETDTPEKTRITEGVSNLIGATVSSIAESVKAVASTITDRIKSTTPDPDQVELTPEAVEPEAARTDEQLVLSGDAAIAPEAVPAPVAPKKRAATKKPNKRAAKTTRKAAAKKTSKKASDSKGRTMAKKSKKKSVTKSIAGAVKKVAKKAKKAVKKVTKKKKKSKR